MRSYSFVIVGVVCVFGAIGNKGGDGNVDIRGTIAKVAPADAEGKKRGLVAVLLIEGPKTKDTQHDKASVKVTDKTVLKKKVGKQLLDATPDELIRGVTVEAVFTGPVLESYPVQATASKIVILGGLK